MDKKEKELLEDAVKTIQNAAAPIATVHPMDDSDTAFLLNAAEDALNVAVLNIKRATREVK